MNVKAWLTSKSIRWQFKGMKPAIWFNRPIPAAGKLLTTEKGTINYKFPKAKIKSKEVI